MTEYCSLDRTLMEAAMIVVANDATNNMARAFSALRNSGFTTRFVSAMWEQIQERARELDGVPMYSRNIVFLSSVTRH